MKAKFFSKVTLLSALLVMVIAVVAGCGGEQQAEKKFLNIFRISLMSFLMLQTSL